MTTRPTAFPTWATTGQRVTPTAARQLVGFVDSEEPPAGTLNWLLGYLADDVGYLDSMLASVLGTGVDGALAFDGANAVAGCSRSGATYTMLRDIEAASAVVSAGVAVKTDGFRLYCSGLLDMSAGTAPSILCAGHDGSGVTAGAAQAGILATLFAGHDGSGPSVNGVNATNATNALGGAGGASGAGTGGAASGAATATAPVATLGHWRAPPSPWTGMLFGISAGVGALTVLQGGAGGGGGGGAAAVNSGGGGGAGGGVLMIATHTIALSASAVLGAYGGRGGNATGAGGGGGGGGGGGAIFVSYRALQAGSQTVASRCDVAAGAGGTAGAGGSDGSAGSAGQTFIALI